MKTTLSLFGTRALKGRGFSKKAKVNRYNELFISLPRISNSCSRSIGLHCVNQGNELPISKNGLHSSL